MKFSSLLTITTLSCAVVCDAFTPITTPRMNERKLVSMAASKNEGNIFKTTFATVGALLLSTMVVLDDASAMNFASNDLMIARSDGQESSLVVSNNAAKMNFGSSELLAARSGGRGGGRAMSRPMARPSPRSYSRPATTIRSNTYIAPTRVYSSPIIMSPFGSPFGYGYGGGGGFGLGYGLGAMSGGGGRVDQRALYEQEKDLAQSKADLEVAKQKEADLEVRIKALEQSGNPQVAPAVQQVAPAVAR